MQIDWSPLDLELAQWRRSALDLPIWWRDDDAVSATPDLDRLTRLSEDVAVPVHLAVIPKFADTSLSDHCAAHRNLVPVVHGWSHQNHAPAGEKKAEFGHPRELLTNDAAQALDHLKARFGVDIVRFFVPPWNRIDPTLVRGLAALGYQGLSTFTPRKARFAAPGLVQINTHIDPIHWRGGGGLVPTDAVIATLVESLQNRRRGDADAAEPLGILTHHLVHDEDIWRFTESCLKRLLESGARPVDLSKTAGEFP